MSASPNLLTKLRGKKWVKWLGYGAFSWMAFSLALYLTFPSDAVRDTATRLARQHLGMNLRIESVGLAFPPGISLHDTFWILREPNPEEQQGAIAIHIDKLTVRPNLLGLITGKTALRFNAKLWGGNLAGSFLTGEEEQVLEAKAKGIELAKSVLGPIGLDLEGTLDEFSLSLTGKELAKAEGSITLGGSDLVLRGGEVAEFELPRMTLGKLDGTVAFNDGRAEVEKFVIDGQDIEAKLEGNVRLAQSFSLSTLTATLSFKPSSEWWKANEMLQAGANMAMPPGSDGFHSLQLYGQLTKPRFRTR